MSVTAQELDKAADALNTIAGVGKTAFVTLADGATVEIYKCKTKQVGLVLKLASSVMRELGFTTFNEVKISLDNPANIADMLASVSDDVFTVAAELCSLSYEAFMDLAVDDALHVVIAIFELNKDFFLQRVLPLVQKELHVT
jgi:divalent metal cation (Fe/Co/Zn/Cd) transporter